MDTVPKIEVDIPSTLDLSEHVLPAIKEWEVGKRYLMQLSAEMVSQSKGSMHDPNDQSEVRASFRVLGAESIEDRHHDNGMSELDNKLKGKSNKETFVRALALLVNDLG